MRRNLDYISQDCQTVECQNYFFHCFSGWIISIYWYIFKFTDSLVLSSPFGGYALPVNYILERFYFFRAVSYNKIERKGQRFPYNSCSYTCIAYPLSTSLTRAVHLLQLKNVHWHVIITQSHILHYGSLRVVYSVSIDKWIMTCIYCFISIQCI